MVLPLFQSPILTDITRHPQNLNPLHEAKNPKPYFLDFTPEPKTLNPKPLNPEPKSQSLNPGTVKTSTPKP